MNEELILTGAFAGVTAKPQFNQLAVGDHVVKASKIQWTDSFTQFQGDEKTSLPAWSNPVQQVAVVLTSTKPGDGAITVRLSAEGFYHVDDLSDDEIQAKKFKTADGKLIPFEVSEGFIMVKNKAGKMVRIPSAKNTEACTRIINSLTSAAGVPEGTKIPEALDIMVKEGLTLGINVVNKPYAGRDQFRIQRYYAVKKEVSADATLD